MSGKLARNLHDVSSTALDMLLLRYPGFVYGESRPGAIPVFCFHGVDPISFEAMLRFLVRNEYVTLDADEYHGVLTGRARAPVRSVVLTFDDGWGSLWSVGFPLLKQYGIRIVVFLATGRIGYADRRLHNLDDLHEGRCSPDEVLSRDRSDHPLLTWAEIAEMHASGLVDFQSHSHTHSLVCRSTTVVDFISPRLLGTSNLLELPSECDDAAVPIVPDTRLGAPLFETAPRLSDVPSITLDRRVAEVCVEVVRARGGSEFFSRPDWREILVRVLAKQLDAYPDVRVESPDEQIRAIRRELAESKRLIEDMLPGKVVRHICYPWHIVGDIARREALVAGYSANYLGRVGGKYYNPIPNDPLNIARLGSDFFFRLPGKGRAGLLNILTRKAVRRARHGSAYLTH